MVKDIKAPKFANVIRYLDEACNNSLLTEITILLEEEKVTIETLHI